MANAAQEIVGTEIGSGLQTTPMLDAAPPCFRVSWIRWDSGFRGSGLRIGDRIVAVNGVAITKPPTLPEVQRAVPKAVGQYAEYQTWAESGAHDGDKLVLRVRRRRYPGSGWEEFDIAGQIRAVRQWINAEQRRLLGPDGPDRSAYDGFPGAWGFWYDEKFVPHCTQMLDGVWTRGSFNSRYELTAHFEDKPRIDFLAEKYPGAFSAAARADWEAVRAALEGPTYALAAAALEFRRAEEERVQQITGLARQAWDGFLQAHAADTIAPFPGIDPVHGDRASVVGKYVVLPPIGNRDWITHAGRNFLAAGQDRMWYFADTEAPAAQRMFLAGERYRRIVSPQLGERYSLIGRILPEPRILVIGGRGTIGLQIELAAALVGDAMFVDLTRVTGPKADVSPFAGEETLQQATGALPTPEATPAQVLETLIVALKEGDQALWTSLFAHWYISYLGDGRPVLYPHSIRVRDNDWVESRRRILGDVCDVRVVWTGEPREVTTGREFDGAPRIEEVDAEVEHIGAFDGIHRPFLKVGLNRLWQLQRVNGGPWRISSVQGI